MFKIVLLGLSFLLTLDAVASDGNDLLQQQKLFSKFLDKARLQSYLSSFGDSFSESQQHKIYKRAPARVKKMKISENKSKPMAENGNKNFTITPRQMIKFEMEDAKYNEDYEQLKNSRKLRIKRSLANNSTSSFREPKEFVKFLLTDAVTPYPEGSNRQKKDGKIKREVKLENLDSQTDSTKSIRVTHPLSPKRKNRFVTFEDLPEKLQKSIESAVADVQKRTIEGDFLKFYYGDKIIKIPSSMWKYISSKSKSETKAEKHYHSENEEKTTDYSEIFKTKDFAYITTHKPTTVVEKAKSYMNFDTPKEKIVLKKEEVVMPPKKSYYFYAPPSTVATPIATFESNRFRETIPISEDIDENGAFLPVYQSIDDEKPTLKSIPTPTSYVEFNDHKYVNDHELDQKNYEFGYHVSDYKTGNNFGHTQSKKQNVINGQYSILLPDGRIQITKYIADDSGFHADITYQNVH